MKRTINEGMLAGVEIIFKSIKVKTNESIPMDTMGSATMPSSFDKESIKTSMNNVCFFRGPL